MAKSKNIEIEVYVVSGWELFDTIRIAKLYGKNDQVPKHPVSGKKLSSANKWFKSLRQAQLYVDKERNKRIQEEQEKIKNATACIAQLRKFDLLPKVMSPAGE